ncbi:MAG: rRNA maturation RNase YbeY [Kiritimatiellae bacterium]|nr:rRNA maturation RNase YbeY [Kiritimatiellia bacterium]
MTRAARRSRRRRWAEVTLILLNDRAISRAHARCFGAPQSTDVISQAYRPDAISAEWCGEILVNVAAALRRSKNPAGASRELALYVAHGCDHLTGGRDDTPARRRAMLARNRRALKAARAAGLSLHLLGPPAASSP